MSTIRGPGRTALKAIYKYLGKGAKIGKNKSGDIILQSKDGLREIRFDFKNTYPHKDPHIHVIEYMIWKNKKKIVANERIFPK